MTTMDSIRRWPWFAFAFAIFPLLHVAAANPGQVGPDSLARTLAVALLASGSLLVLLRLLLGDWLRAGLGVSWFALLFFSYGSVDAAIDRPNAGGGAKDAAPGAFGDRVQIQLSVVWVVLLAAGIGGLRRLRQVPERLPGALQLVSLVLVGFALARMLGALAGATPDSAERQPAAASAAAPAAAGDVPDIYFILLDGYARADVLAQYYGHDNGPFLRGLEQRGFQVAEASQANYSWTFLSLTSTLNMTYLPNLLGSTVDPNSRNRKEAYRLIRDNRAAAFLRERGYRYVHLQSTWGGTSTNPVADEFKRCGDGLFQDDYLVAIQEVSWLRVLGGQASLNIASCHLRNFETLAGLAREPGPKFVLAHFVPPHHPYLFDREGRVLREANLSNQFEFQKKLWEDRDAYRDQLIFISRSIERVIDRLIADSRRPPVILLLSDHGPSLVEGLDFETHNRTRLSTLSAIHLPGAPADLIPEDVSNVNLLRLVFNQLFDAGLPLLPVHQFMSTYKKPYLLMEVDHAGVPIQHAPPVAQNP